MVLAPILLANLCSFAVCLILGRLNIATIICYDTSSFRKQVSSLYQNLYSNNGSIGDISAVSGYKEICYFGPILISIKFTF